jgi:hypothetical protein
MCEASLLQPTIRIVSITSSLNGLSTYGDNVQKITREADTISDINVIGK